MGETWGISGPAFLAGYLALAAVVWVATTRARRRLADGRDRPGPGPAHPHDLAFLNGGAELAVTSALTSMHLTGTVAPQPSAQASHLVVPLLAAAVGGGVSNGGSPRPVDPSCPFLVHTF